MSYRLIILVIFSFGAVLPARAQPVTLVAKNSSLTVDVTTGARIISLKLDGQEILGSSRIHPHFYGSSLWLSPEGKWKGMGPLDAGPYTVLGSGQTTVGVDKKSVSGRAVVGADTADASGLSVLRFKSPDDSIRGFSFTKEFRVNETDTSFLIHYTIRNIAAVSQEVAPWEVTRVPTGGLAFFPGGDQPALTKSNLPVRDNLGVVWYPYDSVSKVHQKLFQHGAEGWTAYVKNGIVFIKVYPVISPGTAAPGEENVEMYANPEKTYIELENQGAYLTLPPNGSLQYEVKWMVRRLPATVTLSMGHAGSVTGDQVLVNWVRSILNKR